MTSMSLDNIFQAIDAEIARLKNVRALLETQIVPAKNGRVAHHTLSAAARKRISKAQRKRWRMQKAAARATFAKK